MEKKPNSIIRFARFLLYKFSQYLVFLILFLYNRLTYKGKRNIPRKTENGIIIASNHSSYLDPFIVGVPLHRRITFLAKKGLFKGLLGWWVRNVGAIPVDREDVSTSTLRKVLNKLKQKKIVVIFPEGTRSRDGKLQPFKKGIGLIVKKSKAVVIPAYLKGIAKIKPKGVKFPNPVKCTTYYGPPVDLSDLLNKKGSDTYQAIADRIYNAVAELKKKAEK
jgi:1-acyl-sn-glycerol-3-phosphate acyltransferase